ncbi:MAG: fibronectin type III domain-containing protein [Nitrosopumilus sp.]|uniref:fibronectin type III domain-containing protein n=1 Tax=Nitrosopumilus sp. TaxID=2024843 RepID=UPI00247C8CDE|nr:fibronectin type III domain-containing protein [Nitrosopumilus sp.]MCV0393632.1 fibronectin type III domain-containing protein [Nitrosopumilus sp.]
MKALAILPILLILAISPFLFEDAFADHVSYGDNTGTYDDRWWWAEVDNTTGDCESIGYDSGFENRLDSGGNFCWVFKSFKTADLELGWSAVVSCGRSSSSPVYYQMYIYDGMYDPTNSTHFPTDSPPVTLGAGLLVNYGTNVCPTSGTPDLSASTEEWVTFVMETEDDGAGHAEIILDQFELTGLSGVNSWRFCQEPTSNDCATERPFSARQGSGESEYGYVYSYDPETVWRDGAKIVDLGVVVTNNTSVNFTWTEIDSAGIGIQAIANGGLNSTGYMLEYKNGTASESDYWTLITANAGDVETYETGNIFEAGHSYTARVITLGGEDAGWLSEPSNEVTFTMSGTSASTQTYDEAYYVNGNTGVDNRVYYREQAEYSLVNQSGVPNFQALCSVHDWYTTPANGYQMGTPNSGYGTCYSSMLVLPTAEVDGVEWTWTGLLHRSVAQVYHTFYIYDGALDVYNGTQFTHGKRNLGCQEGDTLGGQCMLYENGVPTSGTETWTPDLSSAQSDYVTFVVMLYDNEFGSHDVWTTFTSLAIDGYKTFYSPNTSALQLQFPETEYISGTEHDWGYFNTLFIPTPTLSTALSGDDIVLTWTVGSEAFDVSPTGYRIDRECPSGGGWKTIVADTGTTDLTYTDVNPFAGTSGFYEETFDDDVYQASWMSQDDQSPNFITYHSGSDVLLFGMLADAVDQHIVFPLSTAGVDNDPVSDTEWVMEYKISWTDTTTGTGANYHVFGLSDLNSGNFWDVSQDFLGIIFWVDAGGATTSVYTGYRDGASRTTTDTGFNLSNADMQGSDYFIKLSRTSPTNFNIKMYSGSVEDVDNLILNDDTTIPATITSLGNILGSNFGSISVASETLLEGSIDNLKLGDAGNLSLQSASTQCNYRIYSVASLGTSEVSNESATSQAGVSLTSPSNLVCNPTGTDRVQLIWNYNGAEVAEGFRIDGATPKGAEFTTYVADTGNANTVRTVTGLLPNTEYNFKVAVLVSPDTSGFSNEYSCRTNSASGGGGSTPTTPTTPTVTDPETGETTVSGSEFQATSPSTPISQSQQDLFDLSFPLIQELTNSFSGDIFTLVGGVHFASVGQTVNGNLLVGWDNTNNIIVNSIIIADSQMQVNPIPFPPYVAEGGEILSDNDIEQLSIVPPDSPNIESHQLLPYEIVIPSAFCGTGIEPCVEAGTHKIPVKVISTQGGQNVANNARIEITVGVPQIQFDIPTFVMFALVGMGLVGSVMVARRFRKKGKTVTV